MIRRLYTRPELRQRLVELSPSALLKRMFFWRAQIDFWLVIAGSAIAFVILAPYTYIFDHGWVFLTITVQLLAVYGAVIAIQAMAKIEIETAIVNEVEIRGARQLGEIKGGQTSRVDLQHLEEDLLPNNQSSPPPSMIRMFQQLFKEARDRKFESSVNIVQPYREEALEDIFRLQNIQKIALWLGILGTFIGLLRAIQVGNLGKLNEDNFLEFIAAMFANLFISFSASLAGLEVAVILGALLLILRKRHEIYFQVMESSVVTVLSLARNTVNKDDFFVEFGQIRHSLNTLRDQLYNQTEELSADLGVLSEGFKLQTTEIQNGMHRLSGAGVQFDSFLKQATDRHQQLIDDVKSVYDSISLRNLGAVLQESVGQSGKTISDVLTPNVTRLASEISKFNLMLDRLSTSLDQHSQAGANETDLVRKQVNDLSQRQSETLDAIKAGLRDLGKKFESVEVVGIRSDIKELSGRVNELNLQLTGFNNLRPARKRSLRGFLSGLRWKIVNAKTQRIRN